jgi:hypothetical protein
MHLQYNVRLASGETASGVGAEDLHSAERDPVIASVGALAQLAQRIADAGINIRLVSGQAIETGGSVVLSVGSSDEHDHHDEEELERLLDEYGYAWEPIIPTRALLTDQIGALADWARGIAATGRLIDSIALGTPDRAGKVAGLIPLQATTILVKTTTTGARRRAAPSGARSNRSVAPSARRSGTRSASTSSHGSGSRKRG